MGNLLMERMTPILPHLKVQDRVSLSQEYLVLGGKIGESYNQSHKVVDAFFLGEGGANLLNEEIPTKHSLLIWGLIFSVERCRKAGSSHSSVSVEYKISNDGSYNYTMKFEKECVGHLNVKPDGGYESWVVFPDEPDERLMQVVVPAEELFYVDGMFASIEVLLDIFYGYPSGEQVLFNPTGKWGTRKAVTMTSSNEPSLKKQSGYRWFTENVIEAEVFTDRIVFVGDDQTLELKKEIEWSCIDIEPARFYDLRDEHHELFGDKTGRYDDEYHQFTPNPELSLDDVHAIHLAVYEATKSID